MAVTVNHHDQTTQAGDLRRIAIDCIDPAGDNPRRMLTGIDELAASIATGGCLSPVVVEESGERFRLVAGARRHTAARKAGLTELPALVRRFAEPQTRKAVTLSENGMRVAVSPTEAAKAYAEVLALPGVDADVFQRQIGKPRAEVDGRLAVLALPRAVHKRLDDGPSGRRRHCSSPSSPSIPTTSPGRSSCGTAAGTWRPG